MDKKMIELIENGALETDKLSDKEKDVALNILKELDGQLIIRATKILTFCIKAITYKKA